ncbi:MAG TPA: PQQ-binding-like beta-propeller repeat protein, partial [Prolixibacteraceae bacterium]|nr:PQQ-binding-like beta-propeller repeat protein [Prolixibacteraceae bacterium]
MWIIFLFFLLIESPSLAQDTGCWNIFRGNERLTGSVSGNLPDSPKLLWTYSAGSMIKSSPVACQGKIIVTATDGHVICLNTAGKEIWKFKTSNSIEASALILENQVIIGNLEGILYALNLTSGKKNWE